MWAEHITPTGPGQKPILWVYQPEGLGPFFFQRVGQTSKNLWVQKPSVESPENRLTADDTRSQLGPGSSRPACVLPVSPLPSVHLTLSFRPPSPSLSVICLSLSLSISCSLSVHLQVAAFHLHLPVSLLCVGLSHTLRLLTSLSRYVSLHLCLALPVCVSVSLCLCVYISLSLYLSMSRPISLLRSLKPEIRLPSSACSKVHLTVSQGARAVDNC